MKKHVLSLLMAIFAFCIFAAGCDENETSDTMQGISADTTTETTLETDAVITNTDADADADSERESPKAIDQIAGLLNPSAKQQITKDEAKDYFEAITSNFYYHLLEMPVDQLKKGIDPYYWLWLADPEAEGELNTLSDKYITTAEKSAITGDGYQLYYAAYAKVAIDNGLRKIWGADTLTWENAVGNQDKTSVIATKNYLLAAQGFGGPYDEQYFQIKSVKCDDDEAVVSAYALERWDSDDSIHDLSNRKVANTTEYNGLQRISYEYATLGTAEYHPNDTVESLLNAIGASYDELGTVDFHLKQDKNGNICLVKIQCNH